MNLSAQNIKEKMDEFARLFSIERNLFQRFVIVYKYIRFLNSDPLVKNVLQKIFDDTAKVIGEPDECMDEDKFLNVKGKAIFSQEFWIYFNNLETIYGKMKKMKNCRIQDKKEFDTLCRLFSKPYSKQMLELSFKVVNSEVFDRIDQECFFCCEDKSDKTYFDEKKSILYVKGRKIKITKQDKITNAHKILKYIFIDNKDNLNDDFYYSEIAEDEFGELEYNKDEKAWKKYHDSCKYINKVVEEKTKKQIKKFLIHNTGSRGRVKINKKYI